MPKIKAVIEGEDFKTEIEFDSSEVMMHHMPGSKHGWDDLSEQDQISFSEDYALWTFARKYGNNAELRVDVEISQ